MDQLSTLIRAPEGADHHHGHSTSPSRRVGSAAALRKGLLALLLALVLMVTGAGPAAAHASLVSVDPPDGSRLDQSPATVTLTFTERVSADLGGVRVVSADGTRVEQGAARVDGSTVSIDLRPDLPEGTYVVSYRVISADGHPVRGGSVFGVGEATVDADALSRVSSGDDDRVWEIVGGVGRGLAYAGVLLAAGGALFLVLAHQGGPEGPRLRRVVTVAAVVGGLASLVSLPVQAALGTGQGPLSLFDPGVLSDVSADGVGLGVALTIAGSAVLVVALRRWPVLAVAGAVVAAGSFAATGHTRVGDTATLATLADLAHLEAAAVWAGGLVLLWLTLRWRRQPTSVGAAVAATERTDTTPAETALVVARFSRLATVSVLIVGAAGVALSWSEVRSLNALTSTGYGLFLIAKVAVVAAIAALGAYNHFRLVPAVQARQARAGLARLQQTLRLEVLGLVAVLVLTSILVVMTPAKTTTQGGVVEKIVSLGDAGSVQLVVAPAKAGFNQIHIYTYDSTDRPADIAEEVTLELSLPEADLGPITRTPERAGPAHFQLDGDDLAVAGRWEITIQARIDRFTEASGTTDVDIAR